jgi:hypothetical protein
MTADEKIRENRLRRAAARQGCKLLKLRLRDPRAIDYGKFVIQPEQGLGRGPFAISQIEGWLNLEPL